MSQDLTNRCLVCCGNHVDFLETPKKKRKCESRSTPDVPEFSFGTPCSTSSLDLNDDFTPDSFAKESFNKSMGSITNSWSPIKYQARTNFHTLNKKTQEKMIRKGKVAVDAVLEKIAPGQGNVLKQEIFKNNVEIDINEHLKEALTSAVGNVKIQLLSIVAGKDGGKYMYTIQQLQDIFPGTSKHYIEQARKHAANRKIGMPIEAGKYCRKRLADQQINHFLDFIQYGGLVQDVASGTRQVTLSTKRKAVMPNVIRMVHKAEIIRLYEGVCNKEGYVENRPSTRTLWNILTMCPASQRKSLAGLDNVAAEGSDAFDTAIRNIKLIAAKCSSKKEEMVNLESALQRGRRYLKGEYKSNCSNIEAEFADHCRKYALSDSKTLEYKQACNHEHKKQCFDCEDLKDTLVKIEGIDLCFTAFTDKEGEVMMYEFAESCKRILAWKAHILTVIHQDSHKHDILENLNNETAFIIIDFAMKFLSQKYRESMASWFGKSGNGMHVMCVIFKENGQLVKRTYIAFIGKTPHNFGAVIAIYESCLQQIRKDSPNI